MDTQWMLKFVFVIFGVVILKVEGKVSDNEYALMPPIFHLDDFDSCLTLEDEALYCWITVELKPMSESNSSHVWEIIQEVISNPKNYRHDILRHGICLSESCPNIPHKTILYNNNQDLLKKEISQCYSQKYSHIDIKGYVSEIHCETDKPFYDIDSYDIRVGIALFILFGIVMCSSIYEGLARYKTKEEYDKVTSTKAGKIISCFSIPKNWKRLGTVSNNSDAVALRSINGIRFYNMCLVIMAHTCMINYASPTINPKFFETITEDPLNMLVVNGNVALQTFFVMAGWLLSYRFFLILEKEKDIKFSYIIIAFINRYIRLTASYSVVVAINSTLLYHFNRGPVWDKLVGSEYRNCRISWWKNLLYINNYYDTKNICMPHSWYLAADTQLFLLTLFIIMIMWKYQQRVRFILGTSLFIAVLLPGLVNYIYDFDIVMRQYPEALYVLLRDDIQWHLMFIPTHTNAGSYIIGVTFGYIFYKYQHQKVFTKKMHVALWWILTWIPPLFMIFMGIPIYNDNYQNSRILAAIYASMARNIFALAMATLIFGVSQGIGWIFRDALTWLPLQPLGKLTYCAYLIHAALIRIRAGLMRSPNYINSYILVVQTIGDVALAYIFALVLCLFVELPVSALQKQYFSQQQAEVDLVKTRNNNADNTRM